MLRRTGMFGTADVNPQVITAVTPKMDGEALYIRVTPTKSFAVDRIGNTYKVKINGRFEAMNRELRCISMLTEWVPKIGPEAEVFVTHVWQFGTPNGIGLPYTRKLLNSKTITIGFKAGDYKLHPNAMTKFDGTMVPIRFPSFERPSDGLVVHKGCNQRFLKPYRTVDIKKPETYAVLKRDYNVRFDKEHHGVLCEFAVINATDKIEFVFIKYRTDKTTENDLDNIIDLITSADFDTWFDEIDLRMLDGTLEQPPGWEKYRDFVVMRNLRKHKVFRPQEEVEMQQLE